MTGMNYLLSPQQQQQVTLRPSFIPPRIVEHAKENGRPAAQLRALYKS